MALDTYANLQASIASWLNRSDLTTQIVDFISLAEAEMSRRLRRSTERASLTIGSKVNIMPCTAAELRSIYLVTGTPHLDKPLNVVTPEVLAEMRALQGGQVGRPRWAAITSSGRELIVAPAPDQSYTAEVIYFKQLQPLSATNTINEELHAAPDLYLYGALAQAEPFLEHDERMDLWKTKFDNGIDQMNNLRDREEFGASLNPVRLAVVF